ELRAVAAQAPRAAIMLQQRPWRIDDFAGAAVAIGGFGREGGGGRVARAPRPGRGPVQLCRPPPDCGFFFASLLHPTPPPRRAGSPRPTAARVSRAGRPAGGGVG